MSITKGGSHPIGFVPEANGLKARFESPYSPRRDPVPDEHKTALTLDAELSRDHGILTIPVRLPRYLMPEWSQREWAGLIESEIGFFHNFVDEAVVQCLSLAIVSNDNHRAEVLSTANEVVIDFRGDLPNKYLPMMLGGYKVGVYRSGNEWPIWLSIQPTYDLAVKEAEKIRDEAGLPKKAIVSTGALSNFLKVGTPLVPILSGSHKIDLSGWIVAIIAIGIGVGAWILK